MLRAPLDLNAYQSLPELRTSRRLNERIETTRIVFRVFDSSSFRDYNPTTGFEATGFNKETPLSFAQLAEAHIDKDNRTIVTPWLSTTRRWLWAVWDMNRRFHWPNQRGPVVRRDSIRVAVIDLNACKGSRFRPVHSLSLLSPQSEKRQFPNISDEVLIYGQVPLAAIISIWRFEKTIDIMGIPPIISEKMPDTVYKGYREIHHSIVKMLESLESARAWQAQNEGRRYVDIVISMMQHGYNRLECHLEQMLAPIEGTRVWAYEKRAHCNSADALVGEMSLLSTGGASEPSNLGVHGSGAPQPSQTDNTFVLLKKRVVKSQATITRAKRDSSRAKQPIHVEAQQENYKAVVIPLARQKIEDLRGIALEFARTITLGLIDELNITPHEWLAMKMCMMERIDAWLAPLENRLQGLEGRLVPRLISQAKTGWLDAEQSYPKWWESCGTQWDRYSMDQPRGRYYTYSAARN